MEQRGALLILLFSFLSPSESLLRVTVPRSHRAPLGTNTSIPCQFLIDYPPFNPHYLLIYWYLNDREILNYTTKVRTSNRRLSINSGSTKFGKASLDIADVHISDEGQYTCSVLYTPERRDRNVYFHVHAPPRITITNNVVTGNKKSALTASIHDFYPKDLDVKWLREGEILVGGTKLSPQRNADGTYRVTSTVTIVPTEENRNQSFSIWVQHGSLSVPLQEDFQLLYEDLNAPNRTTGRTSLPFTCALLIFAARDLRKKSIFSDDVSRSRSFIPTKNDQDSRSKWKNKKTFRTSESGEEDNTSRTSKYLLRNKEKRRF
ncbi:signal-regulatory protein beta-1-like [Xenopus tropicalis]|uniref:Signal-regulatory protein beta-1-like n=1 Tax=Xenopus tropicalis TaxID=8364 RepID=A0A8J1IXC7_XENTR|nr:signal-regulatory protein beta-1-like [Xenopus tropicalis]